MWDKMEKFRLATMPVVFGALAGQASINITKEIVNKNTINIILFSVAISLFLLAGIAINYKYQNNNVK